ncbi:xylulokinase [Egicoccus sp. AB-alg6-2]|uniref:xylulokinase n=1 Tax=Egicoccus sp. AB-alg6-2 TaxID=3242692 RepID=UPI00359D683B
MARVAGIDSSTQSCKVVIRDADTGALVRSGRAPHPEGTEVAPEHWWRALQAAVDEAGGLDDVAAISVGGQQHGMVALDGEGEVVRDALLWNDTRSAGAALDLIRDLGDGDAAAGATAWVEAVGVVPVASFTVTKLRWLAEHEPEHAERVAAVALPHDWLTWRLAGGAGHAQLTTDRSDASGTGYWSPHTEAYRPDLLELGLGHAAVTPLVVDPAEPAGTARAGLLAGLRGDVVLGPGAGDNAAAALALGLAPGEVAVSIGTSGVVSAVSERPTADPAGLVAGFADATGHFLPLVCTLNASRVLDAACRLLAVDHAELARLALSAPSGADGLVLVPYLEGERTPNRPDDMGALHGLRPDNLTPANLARAAVEGLLCGLADGLDEIRGQGVEVRRLQLIGGGARSEAVQHIAPGLLGVDVEVPPAGEYVADGAARQAAWVLAGGERPPVWEAATEPAVHRVASHGSGFVRERYAEVRELTARRWDR